jgi:hypothetical protein
VIYKYRIDFKLASGQILYPYDKEGIIVEAHTAEDAAFQAQFELNEIVERYALMAGDRWRITKIAPVIEDLSEGDRHDYSRET